MLIRPQSTLIFSWKSSCINDVNKEEKVAQISVELPFIFRKNIIL